MAEEKYNLELISKVYHNNKYFFRKKKQREDDYSLSLRELLRTAVIDFNRKKDNAVNDLREAYLEELAKKRTAIGERAYATLRAGIEKVFANLRQEEQQSMISNFAEIRAENIAYLLLKGIETDYKK